MSVFLLQPVSSFCFTKSSAFFTSPCISVDVCVLLRELMPTLAVCLRRTTQSVLLCNGHNDQMSRVTAGTVRARIPTITLAALSCLGVARVLYLHLLRNVYAVMRFVRVAMSGDGFPVCQREAPITVSRNELSPSPALVISHGHINALPESIFSGEPSAHQCVRVTVAQKSLPVHPAVALGVARILTTFDRANFAPHPPASRFVVIDRKTFTFAVVVRFTQPSAADRVTASVNGTVTLPWNYGTDRSTQFCSSKSLSVPLVVPVAHLHRLSIARAAENRTFSGVGGGRTTDRFVHRSASYPSRVVRRAQSPAMSRSLTAIYRACVCHCHTAIVPTRAVTS